MIDLNGSQSRTEQAAPYAESVVPPLKISPKTKYTHKYIDILGSKMGSPHKLG